MTKALMFLLAAALGCGRLKPAADASVEAGADAAPRCLLGSAPLATSTVCPSHPELCGDVCGAACVDLATDGDNCGACGVTCRARASCTDGVCGTEPSVLVAAAPGCRSIRLVHEAGAITWADMGHGTLNRISTAGGAVTTLATGIRPAAIYAAADQPLFINNEPVTAGILVRDGAVTWIEAADPVTLDEAGAPHGGAGASIRTVSEGAAPRTLLPAALAPAAPLSALALSPDGQTLYFAAGTRLYKMPSAGAASAADVVLAGNTSGPERGFATALAADAHNLYFPSTVDTWVEIYDLGGACDAHTASGYTCPSLVFGSHPIPLLDTIGVADGFLTWAKENNVWRADLRTADPTVEGHAVASDTIAGFSVTGFAVGPRHAYFGESVFVERGDFAGVESGGPPRARILARGQTWPSSLALDGTNVYWTTTSCDIAFIADSPQ